MVNIKYDTILGELREQDVVSTNIILNCSTFEKVGDFVYISGSNTVSKTDISNINSSLALGVIVSKPTATTCEVQMEGLCNVFTGLIPGRTYFLSLTKGSISSLPPVISGSILLEVGKALTPTSLILHIKSPIKRN